MPNISTEDLLRSVEGYWNNSILERLSAYIRIPNQSPMFDPEWETHGHMEAAVKLMEEWCRAQVIPGMRGSFPAQCSSTGIWISSPNSPDGKRA